MSSTNIRLAKVIEGKVRESLQKGNKVVAIKFYHESTLTSLADSKRIVESIEAGNELPALAEPFEQFLQFLAEQDFGGAAACLCDGQRSPSDSIKETLRIATLLDVDLSSLDLTETLTIKLCASSQAQRIVHERAMEIVRDRMVRRLVQHGTSQEEAERQIDEVGEGFSQGNAYWKNEPPLSFDGLDPQVARLAKLLLKPSTLPESNATPQIDREVISSARSSNTSSHSMGDPRERLLQRIGRLASVAYFLFAVGGILLVAYSYTALPSVTPFAMVVSLPPEEQATIIGDWTSKNLPKTSSWLDASVSDPFFPVRLEPGLPIAFADEEWAWDKKIDAVNNAFAAHLARIRRCHQVLFLLYSIALLVALFHWFQCDIVSGLMMVALGLTGIPYLVGQFMRFEFDNGFWLGPLVVPGSIAFLASVASLAWVTPTSDRDREWRAFWFATLLFAVTGLFLGWAIMEGTHLRSGAGLGFLGGAWLMLHHGWRWMKSRRSNEIRK